MREGGREDDDHVIRCEIDLDYSISYTQTHAYRYLYYLDDLRRPD